MPVTQEFVDAYGDKSEGKVEPHPIEGIPKGMSFIQTEGKINDLVYKYLVAFKVGAENFSAVPLIYAEGSSEEVVKEELELAEKQLLKNYKNL